MTDVSPALQALLDGNARFAAGNPIHPHADVQRRRSLAGEQRPSAVVLTCGDSRVAPELVFDAGLGDLFVGRVAGVVVGEEQLASLVFGVQALGAQVLLVLGHSDCGAVTAAVGVAEGKIDAGDYEAFIAPISPAVKAAQAAGAAGDELIPAAIAENARRVVAALPDRSAVLRKAVEEGRLQIAGGVYDIASGRVTLLD